jgi:hypothetical protein
MNAPPLVEANINMFAVPRWLVLMFAAALLLNSFAAALLATSLVLHFAGMMP